jgi:hypothetical protein
MPTNSNPYSRDRSDRPQPGALTLGKRGRLGRGAQVLPTALAAEVSAARPGTTFRNAHPRSVPGHSRRFGLERESACLPIPDITNVLFVRRDVP